MGEGSPPGHALSGGFIDTIDAVGDSPEAGIQLGSGDATGADACLHATCKVESDPFHARSLAHCLQRSIEIGLEILHVLDSDRDSYERIADSKKFSVLGIHRGMRHDRRVIDQ